jgi:hypothetical protein
MMGKRGAFLVVEMLVDESAEFGDGSCYLLCNFTIGGRRPAASSASTPCTEAALVLVSHPVQIRLAVPGR